MPLSTMIDDECVSEILHLRVCIPQLNYSANLQHSRHGSHALVCTQHTLHADSSWPQQIYLFPTRTSHSYMVEIINKMYS